VCHPPGLERCPTSHLLITAALLLPGPSNTNLLALAMLWLVHWGCAMAAALLHVTRSPPRKLPHQKVRSSPPEDDGGSGQRLVGLSL